MTLTLMLDIGRHSLARSTETGPCGMSGTAMWRKRASAISMMTPSLPCSPNGETQGSFRLTLGRMI